MYSSFWSLSLPIVPQPNKWNTLNTTCRRPSNTELEIKSSRARADNKVLLTATGLSLKAEKPPARRVGWDSQKQAPSRVIQGTHANGQMQ